MHGRSVTFRLVSSYSDNQRQSEAASQSVSHQGCLGGELLVLTSLRPLQSVLLWSMRIGPECIITSLCVTITHTQSGNNMQDIYGVKSVLGQRLTVSHRKAQSILLHVWGLSSLWSLLLSRIEPPAAC